MKSIDIPEKSPETLKITNWTFDRVNYRSQVQRGPLKGKAYVEVQALAILSEGFDARRDCNGFDGLQAGMRAVATDAVGVLNAVTTNKPSMAEFLLRKIVSDLPTKRDWLDPQIEAAAKKLLNIK